MSHLSHHVTLRTKYSPETLQAWMDKPLPAPCSAAGVVQAGLEQPPLVTAPRPLILPVLPRVKGQQEEMRQQVPDAAAALTQPWHCAVAPDPALPWGPLGTGASCSAVPSGDSAWPRTTMVSVSLWVQTAACLRARCLGPL